MIARMKISSATATTTPPITWKSVVGRSSTSTAAAMPKAIQAAALSTCCMEPSLERGREEPVRWRLMRREYPKLQMVIRSRRTHQLRTSMYSAAFVKLPATGTVAIRGTRYQVRSFQEKDWGGEPVTISLLMKG